ncbi:MAG: hypothetical protein GF418_02875, partial [Chitinivibrionales bacterium]|nr:hypothetical protein [Chitinivibrionales bacterium]MBD3394546.1 hypothetical protein [Chitinivibrionales bacterium]
MQVSKTGIFYMGQTRAVMKDFPREFRSSLTKRLERNFLYIFGACAIVMGGVTLGMTFVPMKETVSEKEILKIQERYAQLVLNQPRKAVKEAVKEAAEPVEEEAEQDVAADVEKEEEVERKEETFEERQARKEESREDRRRKREMVSQQVKSKGIFAAITASGGGVSDVGSGVDDLLSAGGVSDLGDIDVSKGSFATKGADAAQLEARRGARTSGVGIEKSSVGKASGARIASSGKVNITTRPPEMKSESGGAVTSKACIQKVINRESRRIKRVYENWLKRDPSLSGQLKVRFLIMPGGNVGNVS